MSILLLPYIAVGNTFVNGVQSDAGSGISSVVTQCLPNSGFTTGLTYWTEETATVRWTNLPAGNGSAYYGQFTDEGINFWTPYNITPGTGLTIGIRYWYTNVEEHSVVWKILDINDVEYSSGQDISNPGIANATNSSYISLVSTQVCFNSTQLWIYIEGPSGGGTNLAHIFIDSITVTSAVNVGTANTNPLPVTIVDGVRR